MSEALVTRRATEGNGAEHGAEKVYLAEADAFVIVVASEIAGIGGFEITRVAESDDIAELEEALLKAREALIGREILPREWGLSPSEQRATPTSFRRGRRIGNCRSLIVSIRTICSCNSRPPGAYRLENR